MDVIVIYMLYDNNEQSKSDDLFNQLLMQHNLEKGNKKNLVSEDVQFEDKKEEIKEIDLNKKDDIMKMINTKEFIKGYWEENEYTKKIKEKYEKEYNLIKRLKNKNIDDNTALTILIIYFIQKEHSELLNSLLMVIKKAKIFIEKKTKDKFENIIKE